MSSVFNSVLIRLEQSFEQLKRFTSDASHELRTPLAAIRSVGEVGLQKEATVAGYRDVIGSMLEEANKLTRLVDSLLTIARADAGQIRLERSVVSATEIAKGCASLFEALLEENGQLLRVNATGDPLVYGDRLLLRQTLMNIVDNAIKHTPRGGTITIRVSEEDSHVFLEVEDTGPGNSTGPAAAAVSTASIVWKKAGPAIPAEQVWGCRSPSGMSRFMVVASPFKVSQGTGLSSQSPFPELVLLRARLSVCQPREEAWTRTSVWDILTVCDRLRESSNHGQ